MLLVLPEKNNRQCEHKQLVHPMPDGVGGNTERKTGGHKPFPLPVSMPDWTQHLEERFYRTDPLPGQELQALHRLQWAL